MQKPRENRELSSRGFALPGWCSGPTSSRDGDVFAEINVLDRLQKFGTFRERTLERLAAADQAHTARTLVDHSSRCGFRKVVITGSATAIDQANATCVAV